MERDFEHAQVRLQVRYASLPDEAAWLRLAAARGLPAYLESARGTALSHWVSGLGAESDAHAIDETCRRMLLEGVEEVARWVPRPWAGAVRWAQWLGHLAELQAWMAGGPTPRGGDGSPDFTTLLVPGEASQEPQVIGEGAPFTAAFRNGEPLLAAWVREWRGRWPEMSPDTGDALEGLVRLVGRHVERFPTLALRDAWPARRTLRQALRYLFRRVAGSPAAVFAYLLMLALDLEHLRADLTRRALFPLQESA